VMLLVDGASVSHVDAMGVLRAWTPSQGLGPAAPARPIADRSGSAATPSGVTLLDGRGPGRPGGSYAAFWMAVAWSAEMAAGPP